MKHGNQESAIYRSYSQHTIDVWLPEGPRSFPIPKWEENLHVLCLSTWSLLTAPSLHQVIHKLVPVNIATSLKRLNHHWLVVYLPLWKILVKWDYCSQYIENKKCLKQPTRNWVDFVYRNNLYETIDFDHQKHYVVYRINLTSCEHPVCPRMPCWNFNELPMLLVTPG